MFTKDEARNVVGIIGNIISLVLFLSPVTTFYGIWKKKSVEQFSPFPYLATFMNCGLWVLYGLPMVQPGNKLVVTINGSGFAIEIVYLSLFIIFSDRKKRMRLVVFVVAECMLLAVLAVLVLTLAHTTKVRSAVVGSICIAGNIMMYAAPLAVMKLVIKTRSVEYMPFLLSLFAFLNGVLWTTYALTRFDPFMLAPNGLGALFSLAQLVLYATFYRSTKRIMAERKAQGEVGLAEKSNSDTNNVGHV
ncbi:hypothetical protein ACJIZ3_009652 [Penstemon smallii]|uniref:Bidirectional sugar transporter SWEET n=1 Tax=Penstemon smallii TaxID=265156 RepID=A0ABD3TE76_9LAMI